MGLLLYPQKHLLKENLVEHLTWFPASNDSTEAASIQCTNSQTLSCALFAGKNKVAGSAAGFGDKLTRAHAKTETRWCLLLKATYAMKAATSRDQNLVIPNSGYYLKMGHTKEADKSRVFGNVHNVFACMTGH